jgi:large conductance mechanosensitive channel
MLRRAANFLLRDRFLERASLFDLAAGLVVVISLQRVFYGLIGDVVLPLLGCLIGGLNFSDSFVGLSGAVTASTLADARKQGAVLAYGDLLSSLIEFLVVLAVLTLMLRAKGAAARASGAEAAFRQEGSDV